MINTSDVIIRLQKLMEQHQLSASAFAEKIGVQRSSISHLLSGRNKPSLDLLVKIEANFEEVSFEWLLNGNENLEHISAPTPTPQQIAPRNKIDDSTKNEASLDQNEEIVSIVHDYADGSFERFTKR